MKKVYKGIFLKKLRQLLTVGQLKTEGLDVDKSIKKAGYKNWNIYAKSPFGSVASVIEYLGRYTHKTAITKHRIVSITEHSVTFNYKDYTDDSRQKKMPLSTAEFLRRFELHFLPRGFVKIRHYGFLQNHGKTTRLNEVRKKMQLGCSTYCAFASKKFFKLLIDMSFSIILPLLSTKKLLGIPTILKTRDFLPSMSNEFFQRTF